MANPRKFSEKIALQNQKQAEETAAFEQIMKEVMGATRRNPTPQVRNQHLHINQNMGNLRAGSLPNVDRIGTENSHGGIDLKSALNNLEEIKKGYEPSRERRHLSPSATQHRGPHSHHNLHHHSGHHRQTHADQKRVDSSPYSTYLSPPETTWRRTNSDSALHQSAMIAEQQNDDFLNGSSFRRSPDSSSLMAWDPGKKQGENALNQQNLLNASLPNDSRPRSCEVPGITIYPSPQDNNTSHHHIPISSNTGSLPDLTNLHFPAPLLPPIDGDDQNFISNPANSNRQSFPQCGVPSPYSCGDPASPYLPQSPYSPASPHDQNAFSPPPPGHQNNSNHTMRATDGVHIGDNNHVGGSSGECNINRSASPSNRIHQSEVTPQMLENYKQNHNYGSPSPNRNQQVCYFPRNTGTRTNPSVEVLTADTSALSLESRQSPFDPQQTQLYALPSNNHYQNVPHGQTYIAPNSPLQQHVGMTRHRSTTPSDHSCSAPTSPVSHSLSPVNSPEMPLNNPPPSKSPFSENAYYNVQQTNMLQNQLEQFKMVPGEFQIDGSEHFLMMPDGGNGTGNSNSSSGSSSGGLYMNSGSAHPQSSGGGMRNNVTPDYSPQQSPQSHVAENSVETQHSPAVYYSTSQGISNSLIQTTTSLIYSKTEISPSSPTYPLSTMASVNNQSPTPHTPTSIPNIILTGPNIEDSLKGQDFAKDLGSAMASMSGSFDPNDLFSSAGLDPIDFDGLNILTDMTDNGTDDTFRLERS